MPEATIVESWRERTVRSRALTRSNSAMFELLGAVLVADVDDDQAARLELVGDGLLGVGLDLALGVRRRRGRSP